MMTYYEILGISSAANQKEIRKAYLEKVKKYHPDLFPNIEEANKQTQLINEAYATLHDELKKYEYDNKLRLKRNSTDDNKATSSEGTYNRSETTHSREMPHYECESCGRQDSTLRVTIFVYVVSLIYFSLKKGWGKILCNRCRIKYAILWSLEAGFLGWWSLYGIIYTFEALANNIKGGLQPDENNQSLLYLLAYDFYSNGRYTEAYNAVKNSLDYKWTKEGSDFLNYLSTLIKEKPKKTFKDKIFAYNPAFFTVPSLVISIIGSVLLIGYCNTSTETHSRSYYDYGNNIESSYPLPNKDVTVPVQSLPKKVFTSPEQTLPYNGKVTYYTKKPPIAPLQVITRYSNNYFIKLSDYLSGKTVMTLFVRGGMTAKVNVPIGTYFIKYAVGEKWYGLKYLFGPDTYCYKAGSVFDFKIEGDQTSGFSLELFSQINGNLQKTIIAQEDF